MQHRNLVSSWTPQITRLPYCSNRKSIQSQSKAMNTPDPPVPRSAAEWIRSKKESIKEKCKDIKRRALLRPPWRNPVGDHLLSESATIPNESSSVHEVTINVGEPAAPKPARRRTQSNPTKIEASSEPLEGAPPFPRHTQASIPDDTFIPTTPEIVSSPHRPQVIPHNEPLTAQHSPRSSNAAPETTAEPNLPQFTEVPNPYGPQPLPVVSEHIVSPSVQETEATTTNDFDPSATGAKSQTPAPHSALGSPPDRVSQPSGSKGTHSTWYAAMKSTLAAVERASDVFTPLKSAVAAVNVILETKDVSSSS